MRKRLKDPREAVRWIRMAAEQGRARAQLALGYLAPTCDVENTKKFTSGKQLWNYDNLELSEKKLVL